MRPKPWHAGFVIGLSAALVQMSYYAMPKSIEGTAYKVAPMAYGFCLWCHPRDLVNWFIQGVAPMLKPAPIAVVIPTMTIVGVFLGAHLTARAKKELRWRSSMKPGHALILGLLVSIFAGILGACPIRILLRTAYFEAVALVGLFAVVFGVFAGTWFIMKRVEQEA